jgi:hypothetical protein
MTRLVRNVNLYWALVGILLLGAALRWIALPAISHRLSYDEAYNGLDALSQLQHFAPTPFFPDNTGRESGWMYLLVPFIAAFDARPFALQLASTMVGILTIAVIYQLGVEVLDRRSAMWAAAALAVFYWPVNLNYLALRANLMPLVGSVMFATFLRAVRTNTARAWLWTGLWLGLLAYTYYSARAWIAFLVLSLLWLILTDAARRKGSLSALFIGGGVWLPLAAYSVMNPQLVAGRISDVAVDMNGIVRNVGLWLQAWFFRGDVNGSLNFQGRPIFDPFLGILFIVGLGALFVSVRRRWLAGWVLGLAFTALLPSLLSGDAPHFLRAIGLIVPCALIAGAGAGLIERAAQRVVSARWATLIPAGLILVSAVITYNDFAARWLAPSPAQVMKSQFDNRLAEQLRSSTSNDMSIYLPFTPFAPSTDPRTQFRMAFLAPRHVAMFNPGECFVVADKTAVYATTAAEADRYQQSLAQFAQSHWLSNVPAEQDQAVFTVFQAEPRSGFVAPMAGSSITFGDALHIGLLKPISSTIPAGVTIPLRLGFKALHPLDRDFSVFIHLYSDPQPEGSNQIWSQADGQLCVSYPTSWWESAETVVQDFALPVPADLPPGRYVIALGVYDSASLVRLPVSSTDSQADHIDLALLDVVPTAP